MKHTSALPVTIVLAMTGCAAYPGSNPITLTGRFTYLDKSLPGCGTVAWASRATFVTDTSDKEVELAVPCIEMQLVKNAAGEQGPLQIGERYTVVLTRERPVPEMVSPYLLDKYPWYLSGASQ
jgi:hypothetical protein